MAGFFRPLSALPAGRGFPRLADRLSGTMATSQRTVRRQRRIRRRLDGGDKDATGLQQPAIEGIPASVEHIHRFFAESGWTRFEVAGEVAFFDSERCVVISDTHQGNLILMEDGLLAPIDLRVQPLSGALLDYVQRVCHKNS